MKKNSMFFALLFCIFCNIYASNITEYLMNDRLFSHSFDSTNEDPKPFGDQFISDKAMQDFMLNGFIKTNVDQNTSNDFLRYYYNYVVNHDSVIAYGKCMVNPGALGGDNGIDTLCYYSVFDSGNLKYEIVIFDFFRRKTYVTEIAFKDGSFTSLLGNINNVIESNTEGKFPELIGEVPYGIYSLDSEHNLGQYSCLKFDKPISVKKKFSKKDSEDVKNNYNYTNEWKDNCSTYAYCIVMTTYRTYVFFTEEEITYLKEKISSAFINAKKETLDKKTEVKKTTNQQTLSDDIPVQMSKNNRDDTEVEISFMSFDKDSVGKNVREYFDTNNIRYKAYSTWRSSGSQDSETFEIEDIKYHGASFSLIEIVISSGDGYFTTDKMDTIDCYFLTEADYEVFISYLKQNYPYSDKSKVFYGKSRLSSKFAEYIYYDEISCDKQKLKVTYDFSVKREHEIELTNETLVGYEPFETVDEVRSVCNPSDGQYTSTIPINDLKGHQYEFQSAVQLEENGKKVLYITIQNWLTWESITISAEEALRTFICNERPFGKKVTKRPEN